jgi:hypothetical protein
MHTHSWFWKQMTPISCMTNGSWGAMLWDCRKNLSASLTLLVNPHSRPMYNSGKWQLQQQCKMTESQPSPALCATHCTAVSYSKQQNQMPWKSQVAYRLVLLNANQHQLISSNRQTTVTSLQILMFSQWYDHVFWDVMQCHWVSNDAFLIL